MHRTPLLLALLLNAPAAAAQLHTSPDTLPVRESPAPGAAVRPDSVPPGVARTLPELLATRVPGVFVERSSGVVGAGSRIRLRGANDVLAPQDPLVVVDGVRYAGAPHSLVADVGGQQPSRLDDLDPEDVGSVRVLHGPAAAALYGSAGANGVIEVRTRRGESGPRVRAFVSTGVRTDPASYPANHRQVGVARGGARIRACTLQAQADGGCTPKPDSLVSSNPLEDAGPLRTGVLRTVGVSVGGAVPLASYYVSADADRETGVLAPNRRERADLRASLAVRPLRGLELAGTLGQRRGSLELPPTGGSSFNRVVDGLVASPLDPAGPDGYPPPRNGARTQTSTQDLAHTTFGVHGEWRPLPWLAATASLGEDRLDRDERQEDRAENASLEQERDAREDRRLGPASTSSTGGGTPGEGTSRAPSPAGPTGTATG